MAIQAPREEPTNPSRHIFVSYSRRDLKWVRQLATDLEATGLPIWLDVHRLEPGVAWDREIELALQRSKIMLAVLSENSATSRNVQDEVNYALSKDRLVVPVLHRSCEVPYRLARLHYIDFTENREVAFQSLVERLKAALVKTDQALPEPAADPDSTAYPRKSAPKEIPRSKQNRAFQMNRTSPARLSESLRKVHQVGRNVARLGPAPDGCSRPLS